MRSILRFQRDLREQSSGSVGGVRAQMARIA